MAFRARGLREVPTPSDDEVKFLEMKYISRGFPEPVTVEAYRAAVGFAGSPAVVSEVNLAGFLQWFLDCAGDDERAEALRLVAFTHHKHPKATFPPLPVEHVHPTGIRWRMCTEPGCPQCRDGVGLNGSWHFRYLDPRWTPRFAIAVEPFDMDQDTLTGLARSWHMPRGLVRARPGKRKVEGATASEKRRRLRGKTFVPGATASAPSGPPGDDEPNLLEPGWVWEARSRKEQRDVWVKLYCRGTTEWGASEGWYAKLGKARKVFADSSPDERLAKVKEWYLRGVTWNVWRL